MKFYIKTFGCQQNVADSERISSAFRSRGHTAAKSYRSANYVIINTCMVRETAENRVYGLVNNLAQVKEDKLKKGQFYKIVITGCMVGLAHRDATGKFLAKIRRAMPAADEFMPIEEVGFDNEPVRQDKKQAWVPISNGCNNFCTFCVVPFTRGREISRPFDDIIKECRELKDKGYQKVTLLGQNVNSYGADLVKVKGEGGAARIDNRQTSNDTRRANQTINAKPIYVKHLGRYRIPTLFPHLLEAVAHLGFKEVNFISSNPWDFSEELIDVIARNKNITRTLHLPVQSGDSEMLKKMNRWYTREEYLRLVKNLKLKIKNLKLTTDIIVGYCGETEEQFENTMKLAREVGYEKAYISMYSQRPMTAAAKVFADDIPHPVKKSRWEKLNSIINK